MRLGEWFVVAGLLTGCVSASNSQSKHQHVFARGKK